jgi:hypothetical protein
MISVVMTMISGVALRVRAITCGVECRWKHSLTHDDDVGDDDGGGDDDDGNDDDDDGDGDSLGD